jgi:hypothetical protein
MVNMLENSRFLLSYVNGEADFLLEADLNDLQERQEFPGRAENRRRTDRHQQDAAGSRVSGKTHRCQPLSGLREHAQPCIQGAAAAEVEEGGDRSDAGEPESD